MAPDDNELILQAQQGDMGAFEQLVYRYDRQVLALAESFSGNAEDAKDIYQEVFIRVYRALPRFEFRSKFSTWVHRIVINSCLTHKARRKDHLMDSIDERHTALDGDSYALSDLLASDVTADQHARRSEMSRHLQQALNALSPQQKMVFTLRHYHGLKLREIAGMMTCAEGTVKKYLFTATERMREQLKGVYS
ncbi:MAG TPA: sigma-70 family RNA polymerase sigma factor [Acidobacteriota bacterium]|jgi:RNA polymerase sigma-70 factor (ECF subfamily)